MDDPLNNEMVVSLTDNGTINLSVGEQKDEEEGYDLEIVDDVLLSEMEPDSPSYTVEPYNVSVRKMMPPDMYHREDVFLSDKGSSTSERKFRVHSVADFYNRKKGITSKLGICRCPGRRHRTEGNDLMIDLARVGNSGYRDVVCLMEWDELSVLGAYKYPMEIQNQGFRFYHLPIVDARTPLKNQARKLVGFIAHQLMEEGRSVMVHCYAGRGRSGTICACVLIHCGFTAVEAIAQLRKVRNGAIAHDCQVQFLKDYEASLKKDIETLCSDETW